MSNQTAEQSMPERIWAGNASYGDIWAMKEKPFALEGVEYVRASPQWREGLIELKRDGDYLVVSIERDGKYIEVIREFSPGDTPIGHAVHPSGINCKLEAAGLL